MRFMDNVLITSIAALSNQLNSGLNVTFVELIQISKKDLNQWIQRPKVR